MRLLQAAIHSYISATTLAPEVRFDQLAPPGSLFPPVPSGQDKPPLPLTYMDVAHIELGCSCLPIQELGIKGAPLYLVSDAARTFIRSEIKYTRNGDAWAGKRTKNYSRIQTNGAHQFRRIHNLPDPDVEPRLLNQLTDGEKELFDNIRGGEEPWRCSVKWLLQNLAATYCEMKEKIYNHFMSRVPLHQEVFIAPKQVGLYRVEFYNEYRIPPGRLDDIVDQFVRTIAPMLGASLCEHKYHREWKKEGLLRRWVIAVRNTPNYKKRYNEQTELKIYDKGDYLRVEITYIRPRIQEIYPYDLLPLGQDLEELALDAKERLGKVFANLKIPPVYISSAKLFGALRRYRIRIPENKLNFQQLVQQVVETGVFDPFKAKLEAPPCEIDARTMRERLAHPVWGIFQKKAKEARNGESTKMICVLREDWGDRVQKYPNPEGVSTHSVKTSKKHSGELVTVLTGSS